MYKMIVVDDNPADRRGISSVFDWSELGIEVAGTFANGSQALDFLQENKTDIVMTDIAMPVMNGIELTEAIREQFPDIRVIFMSCYSDFEFARSAIDLDIYGYILKPIIPGDLRKAVLKLLEEYRLENGLQQERESMLRQLEEMRPMVQERFLRELLLGNYPDPQEIREAIDFLELPVEEIGWLRVVLLQVDDYEAQTARMDMSDKHWIAYTIKDIMEKKSNSGMRIHAIQLSGREFAAILFGRAPVLGQEPPEDAGYDAGLDAAVEIHDRIQELLDLSITIGLSKKSETLTEVHELYRQSLLAANTSFYSKGTPIITYDQIEDRQSLLIEKAVHNETLYKEVQELITLNDEARIDRFVDKYLPAEDRLLPEGYIKSLTFSIVNITMIVLTEAGHSFADIFGSELVVWEKLSRFKTILNIRQWLNNFFRALKEYLNDRDNNRGSNVTKTIKQIIRERYPEQISVEDISRAVYLSPGYANSIFKNETGRTIFDYLLEYRIEMAKKLLREPDSKVTAVSDSVGYANKSYFCLMFKKHVGLTPAEYKNKAIL